MKRGMLEFSAKEMRLINQLWTNNLIHSQELDTRLSSLGTNFSNDETLELSDLTVETILDALPPPENQNDTANDLRQTLQKFLSEIRN